MMWVILYFRSMELASQKSGKTPQLSTSLAAPREVRGTDAISSKPSGGISCRAPPEGTGTEGWNRSSNKLGGACIKTGCQCPTPATPFPTPFAPRPGPHAARRRQKRQKRPAAGKPGAQAGANPKTNQAAFLKE